MLAKAPPRAWWGAASACSRVVEWTRTRAGKRRPEGGQGRCGFARGCGDECPQHLSDCGAALNVRLAPIAAVRMRTEVAVKQTLLKLWDDQEDALLR